MPKPSSSVRVPGISRVYLMVHASCIFDAQERARTSRFLVFFDFPHAVLQKEKERLARAQT